jgi:hypothetical protein
MDLSAWLRNLGLGQYEQAFRDNAIGLDVLLQLTKEDLKEIGVVPVGHRRKLLDAIAALRVSASPASDGAREARVLSASPVDPIGERRQVTVLFADLAGYTAWGQQLDAEEVHALLEQFFGPRRPRRPRAWRKYRQAHRRLCDGSLRRPRFARQRCRARGTRRIGHSSCDP